MTDVSKEKVLEILNRHKIWEDETPEFKPAPKGARADFQEMDLRGIDFSGARLRGALFSNANCEGCDFSGADIRGVYFFGANLKDAVLENVKARRTQFANAIMHRVKAQYGNFDRANFRNAEMQGADFSNAEMGQADLSDVRAAGADFSFAVLKDADLGGANLEGVRIFGADTTGAFLKDAKTDGSSGWESCDGVPPEGGGEPVRNPRNIYPCRFCGKQHELVNALSKDQHLADIIGSEMRFHSGWRIDATAECSEHTSRYDIEEEAIVKWNMNQGSGKSLDEINELMKPCPECGEKHIVERKQIGVELAGGRGIFRWVARSPRSCSLQDEFESFWGSTDDQSVCMTLVLGYWNAFVEEKDERMKDKC